MRSKRILKLDKPLANFSVAVDTREKMPYVFKHQITAGLKQGDYSLYITSEFAEKLKAESSFPARQIENGYILDNFVAIERKRNTEELYSCCAGQRRRFEAELARLAAVPHTLIICEFNFSEIDMLDIRVKLGARECVYGSICSWIARYGTPFLFAGNRILARAATFTFLEKVIKNHFRFCF